MGFKEWWQRNFGEPKPVEPVDVVALHEGRTATMCTLGPQISEWQDWLNSHAQEVIEEQSTIDSRIKALDTTKEGLITLDASIIHHDNVFADRIAEIQNLLDSLGIDADPLAEDVIGLHEQTLTELQVGEQASLARVQAILTTEKTAMASRKEKVSQELNGVNDKLQRLSTVKDKLEQETEITNAVKTNMVAFMTSKTAPPKKNK